MDTKLLLIFIVLNIVNVILQTAKSIATVKCGKVIASLINAGAYGLYTVVIFYTMCDLPLLSKAAIVALCNLIGVFFVKTIEEKMRKEKLWKIEFTVSNGEISQCVDAMLKECLISHSSINVSNAHTVFNAYCSTQAQSAAVKEILKIYNAKYFISESKNF